MGKNEILKNLYEGSGGSNMGGCSYRRFLIEKVKDSGWSSVVEEIASWIHYKDISDVEEALIDYLADDRLGQIQQRKV